MQGLSSTGYNKSVIDLKPLFKFFVRRWWFIALLTMMLGVIGVYVSISVPNTYTSRATLVSAESSNSNLLANFSGQLGGIASLAGLDLSGSGDGNLDFALAKLESREFIVSFIREYELEVPLMAIKAWDLTFLSWDLSIFPKLLILLSTVSRSAKANSILMTSISDKGSTLPAT